MILLKIFEFVVCFTIYDLPQKIISNLLTTALLRAFENVALARLLDLIVEKVFVGVFAKFMPAGVPNELTDWVIIIANVAILLWFIQTLF